MPGLICLSGGLDSAVLLAQCLSAKADIQLALGFCYASKHNPYELDAAKRILAHYNTELLRERETMIVNRVIDMTDAMKTFESNLLRGQGEIPEGHYNEESMKQTVVPARNMIFLSMATGVAISTGMNQIYIGVHQGDHHIYPDCRPVFIGAMRSAVQYGSDGAVSLHAPLLYQSKPQIVKKGIELKVPFHLTRTCYKAQEVACGKCGSCQERLAAFKANGIEDPLEYESRYLIEASHEPVG